MHIKVIFVKLLGRRITETLNYLDAEPMRCRTTGMPNSNAPSITARSNDKTLATEKNGTI